MNSVALHVHVDVILVVSAHSQTAGNTDLVFILIALDTTTSFHRTLHVLLDFCMCMRSIDTLGIPQKMFAIFQVQSMCFFNCVGLGICILSLYIQSQYFDFTFAIMQFCFLNVCGTHQTKQTYQQSSYTLHTQPNGKESLFLQMLYFITKY